MSRILKYSLIPDEEQIIDLPAYANILYVGMQEESIQMWVLIDPLEKRIQHRKIIVVGTGKEIPYADFERIYLGTVIGRFVWHTFEILNHGNYPKVYNVVQKGAVKVFTEVKDI